MDIEVGWMGERRLGELGLSPELNEIVWHGVGTIITMTRARVPAGRWRFEAHRTDEAALASLTREREILTHSRPASYCKHGIWSILSVPAAPFCAVFPVGQICRRKQKAGAR